MKKLFTLALAFAALASCSKVESLETSAAGQIAFGDSFVEIKTREAVDPSTTTASINAFDVWAFMNEPSGTVFAGERVTKSESGEWTYNALQYWVPSKSYYFYAVSPVGDANISIDVTEINKIGIGEIAFTNENGTCDLIYAAKNVNTDAVIADNPDKVHLQFAHLLSKLKFTFTNLFTNENAHLAVKNIVITDAPKVGNIALNVAERAWEITDGQFTLLEFGSVNEGKAFNINDSFECAAERLTIPADNTRRYNIEFDLELYYGDELALSSHKFVKLEGQTFEIGKNYNIKADITPNNFAEEALKPIEFTVEVDEWIEGTFDGKFDWDDGNTPAEPVALPTPAVTATVDVNVVTLTWEPVEGAASYTVQVDDDVVEPVSGTSYTFEGDYEVEYTFNVKAIAADAEKNLDSEAAVVKATTEAKPAPEGPVAGDAVTIAKFLEMKDTTNEFVLTGKITRVVNESYGNFDITDETGTIYIFGLLTPEGTAQKQWAAAGLRMGDTITLKGKYSVYNNSPQIKNAIYISHITAPFISAEPLTVKATATAATIAVKANVAWKVTCDAAWVTSFTQSGENNGSLEVVLEAYTTAENRAATFTLTSDNVESTVILTQAAAGATDTKGTYTSEAFMTGGSGNKFYAEKVSVAGTQYNCYKLGTSSVVGDYTTKAVGESGDLTLSFYAVGWNGKTSKLNVYLDGVKVGNTLTLVANSGAANNTPYTITPNDDKDYYSIQLTGVTETSKIKFETVSGATRAIIFGVQLY